MILRRRIVTIAAALLLTACGKNHGTNPADVGEDAADEPDMTMSDTGPDEDAGTDMQPACDASMCPGDDPFSALHDEVTIIRDSDGIAHIYATNQDDLFFANGYQMAKDRFPQMEFYRRVSTGTLSEVVGSLSDSTVEVDVLFRMLGLKRAADEYWESGLADDDESKPVIEAFTRGVNAYLAQYRAGEMTQPPVVQEAFGPDTTRDWEPTDTAAIAKLLAVSLTYAADNYIDAQELRQHIADVYGADGASMEYALRSGLFQDVVRNAPSTDTTHIDGFPTEGEAFTAARPGPRVDPSVLRNALELHHTLRDDPLLESLNPFAPRDRHTRGSNNWVISGDLTESGFPQVANDPHLGLETPTVFYPIHLHQTEADGGEKPIRVIGAGYVGAPGVVVGRNEDVAWGTTVGFYDYVDVYQEQVTGNSDDAQPATVAFDGGQVPVERFEETIQIGNFGDIRDSFDLTLEWVPHHGPIIPELEGGRPVRRESGEALSVRWVGMEASNELEFLVGLWRAQTPAEVEAALDHYEVGSSNFVFGFTSGDIFYSGQSKIPIRSDEAMTYNPETNPMGTAPFFVLPGDGTAEWEGFVPETKIPHALNPEKGYIVTANNDQVGTTLDNDTLDDEYYLGGFYATGFRAKRIEDRLTNATGERTDGDKLTPQMSVEIQNDGYDELASRITPFYVDAVDTVLDGSIPDGDAADLAALRTEIAGREAELMELRDLLDEWDYSAPRDRQPQGDAARNSAAETLFSVATVYAFRNAYGDEMQRLGRFDGEKWSIPRFGDILPRSLIFLLEEPESAHTWDANSGDTSIFDDLDTEDVTETRLTVLVRSLLDAKDRLAGVEPFGRRFSRDIPSPRSADPADWVWGNLHGLRLAPLLPFVGASWRRPETGLPFYERQGGQFAVTPCNHGFDDFDFTCGSGSSLRMVHEMDPGGPTTVNTVPGGTVADPASEFFDNQFEAWQAGEPMPMRWERTEVEAAAVSTQTLP